MSRTPDAQERSGWPGLFGLFPSVSRAGRYSGHAGRGSPPLDGSPALKTSAPRPVDRILLIGLRTLGDIILTTGTLAFLKEHFPEARIDYLTREAYSSLLSDEPSLHRALALPARSGRSSLDYLRAYGAFLKELRDRRYDLVIDFFARGPRSRIITRVTGASRRMGMVDKDSRLPPFLDRRLYTDRVTPPGQIALTTDRINYLLSRIARPRTHYRPKLAVTAGNLGSARELLAKDRVTEKRYWVVFCGSGVPAKNWPVERFAEIARKFIQKGEAVYCLGGEMDRTVQEAFSRALERDGVRVPTPGTDGSGPRVHLYTGLSFGTLKGLCHLAKGAVGNDSGPLHLAQAVGCASVVVFGPGDHVSYAPFLGRAVHGGLACQPCQSFAGKCPDNQCMKAVSVETVWREISSLPEFLPSPSGPGHSLMGED
jgi:ADP-heptose:LPS heptosyltransferase